jgi:hypothetical protein
MDFFNADMFNLNDLQAHNMSQSSLTPISELGIEEVMKNPHVRSMYQVLQDSYKQTLEHARLQQNLWQENARLTAENEALKNNWHNMR